MPEHRLDGRLGLTVPNEWWASPPLLKSFEAAGFSWVQLHAPPPAVLADPRQCLRHASAMAASLETGGLRSVVHAPASLRTGSRAGDRAFEGLLSYAFEVAASHIVYHACALPDAPRSEDALLFEARSLATLARRAERLGVTIAIENLAPVFPGPETLSASPQTLRTLARRIGSDRVGICLDLGHAHIVAELRRTSIERMIQPVLDATTLFHVHDNLGARRHRTGEERGVDPLRLDLHLPPGRGAVPWDSVGPLLRAHGAPVICEVHPPYRSRAADLRRSLETVLAGAPSRAAAPA